MPSQTRHPPQRIVITLLETAIDCLSIWQAYNKPTSFTSADLHLLCKLEDTLEHYRNEIGAIDSTPEEPDLPF